jgi:membrane-bound lytic murein transglycosylase D
MQARIQHSAVLLALLALTGAATSQAADSIASQPPAAPLTATSKFPASDLPATRSDLRTDLRSDSRNDLRTDTRLDKTAKAAVDEDAFREKDVWGRIRSGYAIPDINNELVAKHVNWYSTRPDYIARTTARASRYLFHVVTELEKRGMPVQRQRGRHVAVRARHGPRFQPQAGCLQG